MRSCIRTGVLVMPILLSAGCASFTPSPTPSAPTEPDPLHEIRAAIADRPAVPGEAQMLPNVELVTFPFRRAGEARRDTVRGVAWVVAWMGRIEDETAGSTAPFELRAREIMVCDGAAVERGEYPLGGVAAGRSGTDSQPYVALWRPAGDRWRLERLWLSPQPSVRAGNLATGCQSDPTIGLNLELGAGVGLGGGPGLDKAASVLQDERYDDQSLRGPALGAIQLWVRVGSQRPFSIALIYGHALGSRIEAVDTAALYLRTVDFGVSAHTLSLLGETRVGPLRVGAGPALVGVISDYHITIASTSPYARDETDVLARLGAAARASLLVPVTPQFRVAGSLGYSYFPELMVKQSRLELPVPLSGFRGVIGVEWRP